MSEEYKRLWWEKMLAKYGSEENVRKLLSERNKAHGFQKGNIPSNKIVDEFTDLDISRQRKYLLRKKNNDRS